MHREDDLPRRKIVLLRPTTIAGSLLLALVTSSVYAQNTVPDGWVEDDSRPGVVQAYRHTDSQAGLDIVRVKVHASDVDRYRRALSAGLEEAGLATSGSETRKISGHTAHITRYVHRISKTEFDVVSIDVFHQGSLLHVVAWMRPTPEFTSDALERDVFSIVEALAK